MLLRRSRDRRWFSYKLRFDGDAVEIEQKGSVRLTRDAAFKTVSRSDFDGDGEPDVLLREMAAPSRGSAGAVGTAIAGGTVAAGRWRLATLVGRKVISDGAVDLTADADFKLISTADFDGDGRADVLLRNAVDGRWRLYLLEAQTVKSELALDLSTSLTDTPVGTADFNNDGRADVLVRRANGTWLLYVLDSDGGSTLHKPKIARSQKFTVQALADFDGDGFTDVLVPSCRWQVAPLPARRSESPSEGRPGDFGGYRLHPAVTRRFQRRRQGRCTVAKRGWHRVPLLAGRPDDPERRGARHEYRPWLPDCLDRRFQRRRQSDALLRHTDGGWMLYALDGDGPAVIASGVPKLMETRAGYRRAIESRDARNQLNVAALCAASGPC